MLPRIGAGERKQTPRILAHSQAGAPRLITPECVRPGQIVLDAGATALPDGTLRGDVTPAAAAIAACTPVPGGIGSVTTALLLRHTVQAAEKSHHF